MFPLTPVIICNSVHTARYLDITSLVIHWKIVQQHWAIQLQCDSAKKEKK